MISICGKKIHIKAEIPKDDNRYDFYDLIFATLLSVRNITLEELDVKLKNIPSFELLPNIDLAVNKIIKAMREKKRIILYGDYDVDGVTSTTIMYDFLKQIGANVVPVLPNRHSGYGLSKELMDLFSHYADVVITLDNGTTAKEEIDYAKEKYGLDVIVLDHHKINHKSDLPKAVVVNPNLSDNNLKGVCTATLSFYMTGALRKALNAGIDIKKYLDLVAIGTVADVMPITYLNRTLISKGLELINKIKDMSWDDASYMGKAGMKALVDYIAKMDNKDKRDINAKDIGFFIAPRINAAGRIRKPILAMNLLSEQNQERAKVLATDLNNINKERKKISNNIFKEAYELANLNTDNFIVLGKNSWHHGVLGIVAGRLSHKLKKPAGVFYINNQYATGSIRSVEGLDVHKLLSNLSDMFIKWGGHAGAAGITMKKEYFEDFKIKVNELLKNESFEIEKAMEVDIELPLSKVDKNIIKIIEKLSPYGELNPEPVFISEDIVITNITYKGYGVKIESISTKNNKRIELNCFDEELYSSIKLGQHIKAVYTIDSYGINLVDGVLN